MAFASTQYDTIGDKYNDIKVLPFSFYERANVRAAVQPYLDANPSAAVLDLACGTGFISRSLVEWGARYVLGVDISVGMIEAARADGRGQGGGGGGGDDDDGDNGGRLRYVVGDAKGLGRLDWEGNEIGHAGEEGAGEGEGKGQFDIVVGTWLLNYAEDTVEMAKMWRSIVTNLKDGGVFIGTVPRAADDLDGLVARKARFNAEHPGYFGATWEHPHKLANGEGYLGRMRGHGTRPFVFEWYHLRKEIHEVAARRAGMTGRFEWRQLVLEEEDRRRASEEYWERYEQMCGHFSILVAHK
ncbi:S-adenosyl-L-methionine-dependent methyltransferase [Pseudovirgaria hyperparasitica]|uniref:S-adenosyl-L-methionine-dependent methyltransferase n=1 Tax=Pseudovirgaria hyperparasitica TaxID=470096 RepID=A0A6A6WMP0_9PEZI|nr:S-adenosyl-L-methionine-dependent methyltransferase [Pseudovirgaria hyperparasitica]KAF2763289.1 S-adenosyl-L-methionine-dependent methyltransferase [Pseudovirgaria hyperparasitica]